MNNKVYKNYLKEEKAMERTPKAPLYRDPIFDGVADPTVFYNHHDKKWWMVYTQRRANIDTQGVAYCHGTKIGIAVSEDSGLNWLYRGTMQGLEFEEGENTFWAPEIVYDGKMYHMYVTYVQGVPVDWRGQRHIIHYTSKECFRWNKESILNLSSDRVIDACVYQLPDQSYRMIYKDEQDGSSSHMAKSHDLYQWEKVGKVASDEAHEGPFVFRWKGKYWMIVDKWKGLGVYSSHNGEEWCKCEQLLLDEEGSRHDDHTFGRHASVVVSENGPYIFYFTHPELPNSYEGPCLTYKHRRTSVQVAKLTYEDGKLLCDRNKEFELNL